MTEKNEKNINEDDDSDNEEEKECKDNESQSASSLICKKPTEMQSKKEKEKAWVTQNKPMAANMFGNWIIHHYHDPHEGCHRQCILIQASQVFQVTPKI